MSLEIQVKDSPFVKVSPTAKQYKLLESSETKVHIQVLSRCFHVPFADYFAIEEDFICLSPAPSAPCCVLRIITQIIYYKSTIFKSKINSNAFKGAH